MRENGREGEKWRKRENEMEKERERGEESKLYVWTNSKSVARRLKEIRIKKKECGGISWNKSTSKKMHEKYNAAYRLDVFEQAAP